MTAAAFISLFVIGSPPVDRKCHFSLLSQSMFRRRLQRPTLLVPVPHPLPGAARRRPPFHQINLSFAFGSGADKRRRAHWSVPTRSPRSSFCSETPRVSLDANRVGRRRRMEKNATIKMCTEQAVSPQLSSSSCSDQ